MLIIGFFLNLAIAALIVVVSPAPGLTIPSRTAVGQAALDEPLLNRRMRGMLKGDDPPRVSVWGNVGMNVIRVGEFRTTPPRNNAGSVTWNGQIVWRRHTNLVVGMPLRSLHGNWTNTPSGSSATTTHETLIRLPPRWFEFEKFIPYRPLPVGMLVNTLFYALIVAGLWIAIANVRERRRMRDGRCPSCAYDITGLATCPECGTRVTGAADRAAG